MIKRTLFCMLTFLLAVQIFYAQDENKFRFDTYLYLGAGSGEFVTSDQPNYVVDSRYSEFILNFDFGKKFGVGTGIGLIQLRGNGFDDTGNFFHQRRILKIPLLLTAIEPITDYLEAYGNGGFFWHNIIHDEFQYLNSTNEDVFDGSGIGAQFEFGLTVKLPSNSLSFVDSKVGIFVSVQVFSESEAANSIATQDLRDDFLNYGLILSSTF